MKKKKKYIKRKGKKTDMNRRCKIPVRIVDEESASEIGYLGNLQNTAKTNNDFRRVLYTPVNSAVGSDDEPEEESDDDDHNDDDDEESENKHEVLESTGNTLQLVVMSLSPGENIGLETHLDADQYIRVESGAVAVVLGDKSYGPLKSGDAVIVPAGTLHDVRNIRRTVDAKLSVIYSYPQHPAGLIQHCKESDGM
jgi:mannose-6-phosphate isomerase-like protein (cupin superfamily)